MAKRFNIFGKTLGEIEDFEQNGIYIVGKPENVKQEIATKRGEKGGYYHSQRDLLQAIDLASASRYKRGIWDDEGQRKTFMNIVNFYRDVMKMKIKIAVSDYIFKPTSIDFTWAVWLFSRVFKTWASIESYDDQITEYAHDLSSYGSCVSKRLENCTERVPLRTIRNTQSAKSLYHAAAYGGYVIIENDLHYNEMEKYPDWDLDRLDPACSYIVQERYGLAPEGLVSDWNTLSDKQVSDYTMIGDEKMVLSVAMVVLQGDLDSKEACSEALLFITKLDETTWPLDECHSEKVDGRWIGRGEIEKQLENQLSRNLNANLRRRGILWSTKKVFASNDDNVQENLVWEVQDGQVIHLKQNGTLTQVNTQSQHNGDINDDDASWKDNSQQNSFAFEVATGEALPSGTPFRLGIILSQAVASHFALVRKTFSNFLERSFFHQLVPIFQDEYNDAHEAVVAMSETDIENFKDDIITFHTNLRIWNDVLANKRPDAAGTRLKVEQELAKNAYAFISVPKGFYKHIRYFMELNLVDDIAPELSDLTTLYQSMTANGDPRAEQVLQQIFALRGESLRAIAGPKPAAPVAPAAPAAQAQPSPIQTVPQPAPTA